QLNDYFRSLMWPMGNTWTQARVKSCCQAVNSVAQSFFFLLGIQAQQRGACVIV
ncbi:MAG: hypothetical protein ACJA1Y_001293, partial [Burkholderiaceae bacterium]